MDFETEIFKKHKPDFKKLVKYGFLKKNDEYFFEKMFKDDEFKATVKISKTGKVIGSVYDIQNGEEYLPLRVESAQGAFVGAIREEYQKILKDICKKCFNPDFFIYPQTNRISNMIIEKYGDNPEFLWEKYSNYGIFRNPNTKKWYCAIMNIDYSKIDKTKKGEIEIMDLKLDKDEIQELLKSKEKQGFYPAWHMNKKNWITLILDETLSDDEIMKFVSKSRSGTI